MKPTRKIEALDLVALSIDATSKKGTKDFAKAFKLLEDAKQLWREQAIKRCPHCGENL